MTRLLALILAVLLATALPARAGQGCSEAPLGASEALQSIELAQRTVRVLEDSGASVALVSRAGQDLDRYGVRYSHMGIVVREHHAGRWTLVHALNDCGSDRSALYDEGMGNFFLSDLFRFEAQVVIPGPELQARLARAMAARAGLRLHEPRYNMLSYAFSTRYQNSNQWVLETLAAAAADEPAPGREAAQRWLRQAGFAPITVEIPASVRLGARLFRANVAFDDHPTARRLAGQIDTVTTESVARFVLARDPAARVLVIR
ncbi:hypothetical protein B0920_05230 [Massilia sp. KIM]|uniref:DUF2145 domain-containing protein n=1 Tax=Massilia sp. KIM TaxID=1955422 RepID=UPI0009900951|nr:DUF2145 domain-containing protein [Massilia sp. KIM]OON62838.1 hypothetical protein B0920_05230 [Massilia sp. KIM]